jgi:hypothetical protein
MGYGYLVKKIFVKKIFRSRREEPARRHQYNDKTIRLVSILLADHRWLPTAQIITTTGSEKQFQAVTVDRTKALESREKADTIALLMAKQAIDAAQPPHHYFPEHQKSERQPDTKQT